MKLLEVIVTSVEDAKAAELGGADRLELIRDPSVGGVTPELSVIEDVLSSVKIPVRAMLRHQANFSAGSGQERKSLIRFAAHLTALPLDGVVLGFLDNGELDRDFLDRILSALGTKHITFHRAIEAVFDLPQAISIIELYPRIDKILTSGGAGTWPSKLARLEQLQRSLEPGIRLITGGGLDEAGFQTVTASPVLQEFHVGRIARASNGQISVEAIARLKKTMRRPAEVPVAG